MKSRDSAVFDRMIEELKGAALSLGYEVREEELLRDAGYRPRSGACRLRERKVILVDRTLAAADRVEVLCAALAGHDLEHVFLSPAVRARLQRAARNVGPSQ